MARADQPTKMLKNLPAPGPRSDELVRWRLGFHNTNCVMIRTLLCFQTCREVQTLPRFQRLRTVRVALNDLAPGGAVVVKFFCCAIEGEGDALAVVAIEAGVV